MRIITYEKMRATAEALGAKPDTVRKWKSRCGVSTDWQIKIAAKLGTTPAAINASVAKPETGAKNDGT